MDKKQKEHRKTSRIEIPIHSKPPPYRPGDGPPLAPLRIALEKDSDAFIVDKRVVPGPPVNGELKLQLQYIVSWPDLPAAQVAIAATKIHDYVSPRTVEDWEYARSIEQDREKEKLVAAAESKTNTAVDSKQAASASFSQSGANTPSASGQRKRGRPSKADILARRIAQEAGLDGPDDLETPPLPPATTTGPSLSTPTKGLATMIAAEPDGIGSDSEDGIYETENQHLSPSLSNHFSSKEYDTSFVVIPGPNSSTFRLEANTGTKSSPLGLGSSPPFLTKRKRSSPSNKLTPPVPVSSSQLSSKKNPTIQREPAGIAVPKTSTRHSHRRSSRTASPLAKVAAPSTPSAKRKAVALLQSGNSSPGPTESTRASHHDLLQSRSSQPSAAASQRHYGFTVAGRSSFSWASAPESSKDSDLHTPSVRPRKKKQKPSNDEESVWVVERLEGDRVVEVDGVPEQQYKVRWEGKWPRGQNPTWEPESNISAPLIESYWKTRANKGGPTGAPYEGFSRPSLKRKYSSVLEAFEGDTEDDAAVDRYHGSDYDASEDRREELMVSE
ncbi:hypothetical protein F4780DRAFT_384332 [Xylariomycetidae sp. FL0641]|nr:hypothetical protein F4780DRAFT_384332 [Xylariomycetidae sp. FL0641]